jgi:hypothetical protein
MLIMNMMADRAVGWVKAKQQQTELKKKETIEKEEYNKLQEQHNQPSQGGGRGYNNDRDRRDSNYDNNRGGGRGRGGNNKNDGPGNKQYQQKPAGGARGGQNNTQ